MQRYMDGIKLLKPRPVAFPLHNFGAIHSENYTYSLILLFRDI